MRLRIATVAEPARLVVALASMAAAAVLSACAGSSATAGGAAPATFDDCFFARTLSDWRPLDDENLILFANGRRPYHVVLTRPAMGLEFDMMIGVYDRDGRICSFGGDAIVVEGPITETITIRSIRRLTDAELDEVYVEFGIRPPAVIDATEVELEDSAEPPER